MTFKQAKWNWSKECQKAFDTIKRLISYPNFNKSFATHMAASKLQLEAAISQDDKSNAFYSRKLNSAQVNYTTSECQL